MERLDILKAAFGEQAQAFEDNLVEDSKAQLEACMHNTSSLLPLLSLFFC